MHHALRYRPQNAGGLFHDLRTRKLYHMVTQVDEDTVRQCHTRYLYGEGTAPPRRATAKPIASPSRGEACAVENRQER